MRRTPPFRLNRATRGQRTSFFSQICVSELDWFSHREVNERFR